MQILKRPAWALSDSEATPQSTYINRRRVLAGMGLGAASLGLGVPRVARAIPQEMDLNYRANAFQTEGEPELTPYDAVTGYNNYYEFGTGKDDPAEYAHNLTTEPWSVEVGGHCENPGTYGLEDLVDFNALEERIYRLRCVEGWSMVIPWVGVPLAPMIERFAPTSRAKYIAMETVARPSEMRGLRSFVLDWPYQEGLRMDEAMNPLTFMAVGVYGKTLLGQNGAPLRLVVPWKYGFKSIKSIVRLTFVEEQPSTAWNKAAAHEYGFYSNVNPNVRHPRWSQATERRIGEFRRRDTLMFNGYGDLVADMYRGMDLSKNF